MLSNLPGTHEWETYIHVDKISSFSVAPLDDFLAHCDFGKGVVAAKTSEMSKFRNRRREFIDRLAFLLIESASAKSKVHCIKWIVLFLP